MVEELDAGAEREDQAQYPLDHGEPLGFDHLL